MTRKKSVKRKKDGGRRRMGSELSPDTRDARKMLRRIHEKRPEHAKELDEDLIAPRAKTIGQWVSDPAHYDVKGVDLPLEFRSKEEIVSLKEERERIAEYKKDGHMKLANDFQEYLDRLIWQEKHPFIYAGEGSQEGRGIVWYEDALENDTDYGFDLHKPQSSFLDVFNLKQRDIKGMRLVLYPNRGTFESIGGAKSSTLAHYNVEEQTMHIPPLTSDVNRTRREQTIRHEIGHHIYFTSSELLLAWKGLKGEPLKMKRIQCSGSSKPAMVPYPYGKKAIITNVEVAPWRVAADASYYFGQLHTIDLSPWKSTYKKKPGMTPWENSSTRKHEAWAETFWKYRMGDWKRQLKDDKIGIEYAQKDYEIYLKRQQDYEESKRPKNTPEWKTIKRNVKVGKNTLAYYSAVYENRLQFLRWLETMDKKEWMLSDPKVRTKKK